MSESKIIVGSAEWLALPALNVPAIKARVDSGAKTSSLHAFNIHTVKKDGETWVQFDIHPIQHNRKTTVRAEAKVISRRTIKSSNGESEKRYVIRVPMTLAEHTYLIDITLSNRDNMGHRMLLGREAMQGRMLVDPSAELHHGNLTPKEVLALYGALDTQSAGLEIGLLASNPDLYSNKRLIEAAEQRGHTIHFLDINQCFLKLDAEQPEILARGGSSLNNMHAIIPRIRPNATFYGCALTRQFESLGKFSLNTAEAISQSRDKLFAMQLMLKSGISIPTSGFTNSSMDTSDLIDMVGGTPLLVKLLEGTQKHGTVLAETKKAAKSVINAFKTLNANVLVQEFIRESHGKKIRCLVIDGKVVASTEHSLPLSDSAHDTAARSIKITPEEKALAVKAARALNLHIAGIDFVRSSKGPLLLDTFASPDLESIETATGKDIAGLMIRSIEKHLNWKPKAH